MLAALDSESDPQEPRVQDLNLLLDQLVGPQTLKVRPLHVEEGSQLARESPLLMLVPEDVGAEVRMQEQVGLQLGSKDQQDQGELQVSVELREAQGTHENHIKCEGGRLEG